MLNYISLSNKLKDLREESGLSLRKLSAQTGLSDSYLSQLERGLIYSPSVWIISILSSQYNMSIDELMEAK